MFGMGCFWGAEWKFRPADGVSVTALGYAGGFTPNPTDLAKNPNGYCGIAGTGISCPSGITSA